MHNNRQCLMMVKSIRFSCTLQLCRSWPKHGDQWGSHCKDQAQATAITRYLHSNSWTPISPFLLNDELFTETEVERGSSCCCEGKWQLMAVTWAWSLEHEPYWCLCFDHNQESWSVSLMLFTIMLSTACYQSTWFLHRLLRAIDVEKKLRVWLLHDCE